MKKKLTLTTFALTLATFLYGQNFGSIGTQWYYSEHAGGVGPSNSEYLLLKSESEQIINGVTTHKITRTYYRYTGDTIILPPIYIYQKSDTVYMYNTKKNKFQSIYIFNALQGDTLTLDIPETLPWIKDSTYRLKIDTIETVYLRGVPLKKYKTTALDEFQFHWGGYFMDRIGGLDWFFPRTDIIPEAGGPIRCYFDGQIDTNFQLLACDYRIVTSIKEPENKNLINVFPNPVHFKLSIQIDEPFDRIELIDLTGKIIIKTNQSILDLEHVRNGLYILTIYFKSGQRIDKKIVKNAL